MVLEERAGHAGAVLEGALQRVDRRRKRREVAELCLETSDERRPGRVVQNGVEDLRVRRDVRRVVRKDLADGEDACSFCEPCGE
jgi:hypothetical protein